MEEINNEKSKITDLVKSFDFRVEELDTSQLKVIALGIGDLLFRFINIQNKLIETPVYISLNTFITNTLFDNNHNIVNWFKNKLSELKFRLELLNDIINNNYTIKKTDFIFVLDKNNKLLWKCIDSNFNFRDITNFNLNLNPSFFNILPHIENYIIFHTKLRLNSNFNYEQIKKQLRFFFSKLKVKKSNIIILGERTFPKTIESEMHGITTIYNELLELKKFNNIIDLSVPQIYNDLDYNKYKKDICLINKAKWNICIGQGGQLCSSLVFGKTIFYNPIDSDFFYKNNNLFNSGHRYFKKMIPFCNFLIQEL